MEFSKTYLLDVTDTTPVSHLEARYFHHSNEITSRGAFRGHLITIWPRDGTRWSAVFAPSGLANTKTADGIFSTPNPDVVCIVSEGAAYWVNTIEKTSEFVRIIPVREVTSSLHLLLFAGFTTVAAFDRSGFRWKSEPLVSDELSIVHVDEDRNVVTCRGWDAYSGKEVQMSLDLETGKVVS